MNIGELLSDAASRLGTVSDSPRLDAEVLLCHALDQPRSYLYAWPDRRPQPEQLAHFQHLLQQRLQGTPVAHLTGQREFWSLPLEVSPHTLIPRPETELLVEWILAQYPQPQGVRFADLGTGTGAIAFAVASERPTWEVVAVERSPQALQIAERNRRNLQLDQVELRNGDWCHGLGKERFDIIASNPPYIAEQDPHLQQGDVRFEPRSALSAGRDGLDDIRRISACARERLLTGGRIIVEHGYDQAAAVKTIFRNDGYRDIELHHDLEGRPRATSARR